MKHCILLFLLFLAFSTLSAQGKVDPLGPPFAECYPNKVFFRNVKCDTIFGETYSEGKKITWFYIKDKYDCWETLYSNGKAKEFGKFKPFINKRKKNFAMVKIGIWNYYDENGNLLRVLDFGQGTSDKY